MLITVRAKRVKSFVTVFLVRSVYDLALIWSAEKSLLNDFHWNFTFHNCIFFLTGTLVCDY